MGQRNIVVALLLIAVAAGYGFMASGLPERSVPNTPGPSFFPWVITAMLAGLSAVLLWQGVRAMRGAGFHFDAAGIDRKAAAVLGAFTAYLLVLPYAGFVLASVPFTALLIQLYGGRHRLALVAGAIGMPVALFLLFREVFNILLPAGWLAMFGG